jgi:hypothetical protein
MDLKKTALIAEIVGGIGIIVSILYLAFEVAENSKNTDISNQIALMQLNSESRLAIVTSADSADLLSRGSFDVESLTDAEQERFYLLTQHYFDLWELAFSLGEQEALDDNIRDLWVSGYCTYMNRPGFREIWSSTARLNAIPEFQSVVDQCFSQ